MPNGLPRKVLIVQLAKLGDMVCITPVLHALRQHSPETKIYVLGNASNKEVLAGSSDVDEYIVFEKKNMFSIIRYLRGEKIDVACNRGTGYIGLVTVLLAGIKSVIATRVVYGKRFETRTYKWLLPFVHTVDFRFGEYMPLQFLRLLEPLGIFSSDTKKHLRFSKIASEKVDQFFAQKNIDSQRDFIVGISPSAGNKIKEWPADRFALVADYILERPRTKVVLIGGENDEEEIQNMIKHIKSSKRVINAQGQFTLEELKAFISRINLFMSVDTGPIYIAEAFDVPTIDIIGPVDEKEQPPQGLIHRSVVSPHRTKPELWVLNARMYDRIEARRQVESITVPMVTAAFDELCPHIR